VSNPHSGLAPEHSGTAELLPRTTTARVVVSLVIVVGLVAANMPTALYGEMRLAFGFSAGLQTVIFAAYVVGMLPGLTLLGPLSDRRGRVPVLALGLVFGVLGCVAFATAQTVWVLCLARVLQGLSVGGITAAGGAAFVDSVPAGRSDVAALLSTSVSALGASLGPVLGGLVAIWSGDPLRTPFLVAGIALLAVMATLGVKGARTLPAPAQPALLLVQPSPRPGLQPQLLTACLVASVSWSIVGIFQSVGPTLLAASLGIDNLALLGVIVALVLITSGLTQLAIRKVPAEVDRRVGIVVLLVAVACFLNMVVRHSAVSAVLASVTAGGAHAFLFLGSTKTLAAVINQRGERQAGRLTGLFFACAYLGLAVPSLAWGVMTDVWGNLAAAAVVLSVITLYTASMWFLRFRR